MKDFLSIVIAERRTLLWGLLISFLLIFPFTFLPIVKDGLTWENIMRRSSLSALYALGFSSVVVIAAVVHNYDSLVKRKRHFDKPAFTKLDFYGRLDGIGSMVNELETFLLGKIGQYYFRLNLVDTNQKTIKIEIIPLIDLTENKELKNKLRKEFGFKQNVLFGQTIKATERDLQNVNFLIDRLSKLEATLINLGAKPVEIDESKLEE